MARQAKQRVHREWFEPIKAGGRKSCPACKVRLAPGESVWRWFEYHVARQHNVMHFCRECFPGRVATRLRSHAAECGCTFELTGYRAGLPDWLSLEESKLCEGG